MFYTVLPTLLTLSWIITSMRFIRIYLKTKPPELDVESKLIEALVHQYTRQREWLVRFVAMMLIWVTVAVLLLVWLILDDDFSDVQWTVTTGAIGFAIVVNEIGVYIGRQLLAKRNSIDRLKRMVTGQGVV